jgi:hypothetical protein
MDVEDLRESRSARGSCERSTKQQREWLEAGHSHLPFLGDEDVT